jgi:divalent metal cation (Fe/Co/Zn/Cd) transporter
LHQNRLYQTALGLALFTILYNLAEGIIATWLGFEDESLALFGFGVDSFIEVISGLGIVHMITRIRQNPASNRDAFERNALRITGTAFYILVIGLVVTSLYNIYIGHKPVTTFWGVIISVLSILVMWVLVQWKRRVGRALHSAPILADANCTLVCIYMSVILLISSGVYELTGVAYIDSIGTLGLAWFAFREGRECFEKANSEKYCGCNSCETGDVTDSLFSGIQANIESD